MGIIFPLPLRKTEVCGPGDTNIRLSPTRIGIENNWSKIFAGSLFAFALKTDNSLYGWGWDSYSQLGDYSSNHKSSPEQIGASKDWLMVSPAKGVLAVDKNNNTYVRGEHSLALKSGVPGMCGTGGNAYGQLGNGTSLSPNNHFDCSVTVPVGIETVQIPDKLNVKVFPNPVSNNVNIQIENELQNHLQLTVLNANGQIVYSENNLHGTNFTIDMSTYPKGIYLLKISSGNSMNLSKVVKL